MSGNRPVVEISAPNRGGLPLVAYEKSYIVSSLVAQHVRPAMHADNAWACIVYIIHLLY